MQKVVVKVGTSTLTQGTKKLSRRFMLELTRQLADLVTEGHQVILVSSGAIAAGKENLSFPKVDRSLPAKQMFAAIGQLELMRIWKDLFSLYDIPVGQLLLTRDDFSHRRRYLNARDTIFCLLQHKVIPIINENDSVATKEIRVGDNDNLSAFVANLVAADKLILLTDQKGLYTSDPRMNPEAKLIPVVKKIDEHIFAIAGGSSKTLGLGTGGMATKIEAAQRATHSGTPTIIASSSHPNVLIEIMQGKSIGTLFEAETTPQESRKRWLLSEKRQGTITIDKGAESKISGHGASLLPSGITSVSGNFERGSVVQISSEDRQALAVGVSHYDSDEIQMLIGKQSNEIEEILGYSYGPEIIHRNQMVRLSGGT